MTDLDATFTEDDIARLNRETIARSGAMARIGGTVLMVIGGVGAASWLWLELRVQDQVARESLRFNVSTAGMPDVDVAERIDVFVSSLTLLLSAAVVLAAGFALRHLSDYTQARSGVSLTGFEVGDRVEEGDKTTESEQQRAGDPDAGVGAQPMGEDS